MDIMKNEKPDCACNSDCCQPQKAKPWKKILFALIVFSAVVIVSFKLFGNKEIEHQVKTNTQSAQQPGCCDAKDTKGDVKTANSEKTKSCCQPTKK